MSPLLRWPVLGRDRSLRSPSRSRGLRRIAGIVSASGATLVVAVGTALVAAGRTTRPVIIVVTAAVAGLATPVALNRIESRQHRSTVAGGIVAFGVATIAGVAALVAVASVTTRSLLSMSSGGVVFVLTSIGLSAGVTRRLDPVERRRLRTRVWFIATPVCVALLAVQLLAPIDDPRPGAPYVAGRQTWPLSTGSRIAYVRLPGRPPTIPTPVVFLHGGPGVPDMTGDSSFLQPLTDDGYSVYVYDQLGSGASSRLIDPTGYSLERNITDLEAIRQTIDARQLILIGHSSGAHLAAGYLAHHPDRVQTMVLISPEPLDAEDTSPTRLSRQLKLPDALRTYALTAHPRALLAYALTQIAPDAAHALAGDAEMDARFDRIYNTTRAALHCPGEGPGPALHGLGMYANTVPQSASAHPPPDYHRALAGLNTPTLILKGSCDYLSWSSATDYQRTLTASGLLYLHGGHNLYQDRPSDVMNAIRAFLADAPLPFDPWTSTTAPSDYTGPAN